MSGFCNTESYSNNRLLCINIDFTTYFIPGTPCVFKNKRYSCDGPRPPVCSVPAVPALESLVLLLPAIDAGAVVVVAVGEDVADGAGQFVAVGEVRVDGALGKGI